MNFQTHNQTEVDVTNVSWTYSTIQATRAELVKAFGEPVNAGCDKVRFQWELCFADGTVATIYDWKKPEVDERTPLTWNIGGAFDLPSGHVVSLVHNAFRAAHGLNARSAA